VSAQPRGRLIEVAIDGRLSLLTAAEALELWKQLEGSMLLVALEAARDALLTDGDDGTK